MFVVSLQQLDWILSTYNNKFCFALHLCMFLLMLNENFPAISPGLLTSKTNFDEQSRELAAKFTVIKIENLCNHEQKTKNIAGEKGGVNFCDCVNNNGENFSFFSFHVLWMEYYCVVCCAPIISCRRRPKATTTRERRKQIEIERVK